MPKEKKEKKRSKRLKRYEKKLYEKKWLRDFLIIIFILTVIILVAYLAIHTFELNKTECTNDSDCILQQITCCSCNMGGKEECMSIEEAKLWQKKLESCSKDIMCIAMYNCKIKTCKCINGKCVGE